MLANLGYLITIEKNVMRNKAETLALEMLANKKIKKIELRRYIMCGVITYKNFELKY